MPGLILPVIHNVIHTIRKLRYCFFQYAKKFKFQMLALCITKGDHGEYSVIYWNEKEGSLWDWTLQKLSILSENCSNKSYWELKFRTKKSMGTPIYLAQEWSWKARKIDLFQILLLYRYGKVDSLRGWILQKLPIISKKCSNKSCWELNFVQKIQWMHMFISIRSGAWGLERLTCFKYHIVLKWESRFTLRLNAAKITDCIKKLFKLK